MSFLSFQLRYLDLLDSCFEQILRLLTLYYIYKKKKNKEEEGEEESSSDKMLENTGI